jgi:putative hemolysin
MEEKKLIDLDAVFKSKNPGLYRWIPGFVMRYLKRVVHQDECNSFLARHANADAFAFSAAIAEELKITYHIYNMEEVPLKGGCILACNHPLGALEGILLIQELGKVRRDIKIVVNDLLLNIQNLKDVFIGVNKHGKTMSESLRVLNDLFSSDQLVIVFPSGMVSRRFNDGIQDPEWKKAFITRARKFGKPILPAYIHSFNSPFFYNVYRFRTFFGIKANLEMFYLVDEMYKQRGKHLSIVFGKLLEPATFTKLKTDERWAATLREETYKLKEQIIP